MRLVDVMLAFPGILLALVIIAVLGPNLGSAMIAVGVSGMPLFIRVVRRLDALRPGGPVRRGGPARRAAATPASSSGTSCRTS